MMKPFMFKLCCCTALLCLGACESLPFNYYSGKSWSAREEEDGSAEILGAVYLSEVSVDRIGGWASIEKEIRGLAPLLFWERGYRMVASGAEADYTADIRVREREYVSGWQTKRSLAVEVRLWPAGDSSLDFQNGEIGGPLPLTAGRVTSLGNRSFSSSETTGRMLALAVKKALSPLSRKTVTEHEED